MGVGPIRGGQRLDHAWPKIANADVNAEGGNHGEMGVAGGWRVVGTARRG